MRIFVGGFGGSGTRVVQAILQRAGYYIGPPSRVNEALDFGGAYFVKCFDDLRLGQSGGRLKTLFDEALVDRDSWSIKHGHLMMCIPTLKEWYPDSRFILVVRHPIDNVLNKFFRAHPQSTHIKYGGLAARAPLKDKLQHYENLTREALPHTDLVVRLEDLCSHRHDTVAELLAFAGVDDDAENYVDIIRNPSSIGRGREHYATVRNSILETLGY